ncbi:MAG: cation transporting ATPase C-terminal domain-containing protein [Nitrospirota bacterium]
MQNIFIKIVLVILSATPLSLILINRLGRIFSKFNPRLGETSVICTNITGTLTENNLAVRTFFYDKYKGKIKDNSRFISIEDTTKDKEPMLVEKEELLKDDMFRNIAITTFLCHYQKTRSVVETIKKLIMECGFSKHKTEQDYEIIQKFPTPPDKKISTIIAKNIETKEIFTFSKGNAYEILKKCSKHTINGKKHEIDSQARRKLRKRVKQLNKNGQKVIAFAYKPLPLKQQTTYTEQFAETEMTFLGVMGVTNPLKENLEESIAQIKQSGIKTYILTRVKERKAVAIGRKQNLINPQYFEAVTGEYLRSISDDKLRKILANKEKDYIFAELKSADKQRIIDTLRCQGETVAVINKKQKNSFTKRVEGIRKGRIISKNHQKFSHHAISCKFAELLVLATALILKAPFPLIILIILGMDILINLILELALRVNKIEEDVMSSKFHPEKLRFINKKSLISLLINSLSMGIILSIIYISSLIRYGWNIGETLPENSATWEKAAAISLTLLVLIQIINAFNLRNNVKSFFQINVFSNPFLIFTSIIAVLIMYFLITFEPAYSYLQLNTLSSLDWQIVGFSAFVFFLIEEVRKLFVRAYAN